MKAYFLNIPNEERNSILDQHKTIYNGYKTSYGTKSEWPLYVQDLANDKGGITVNNRGDVKVYGHMGINENIDEMELDMIGDDLESGVFDEEIDLEKEEPSYDVDVEFTDELDEEDNEKVKENVQESLNWFKRFLNY